VAISADAVTSHLPKAAYRLAMLLSVQVIQPADERRSLIGFYLVHLNLIRLGQHEAGQSSRIAKRLPRSVLSNT
jgi:hypothetical protein